MIHDEEDLLKSIRNHVKNNLNDQIILINAEKSDFAIETIIEDDNHYVIAGELLDIPNHIFCQIAFGNSEINVKNNRNDMISMPEFLVEVAFDNPKKANTYYKSLRYMRALYQTMLNFESSAIEVDGFQVTKVIPMFITSLKRELVVSGVGVSMAIN